MPSRHGQPRPEADETARLPLAAEHARTLVQGNASGVLVIPELTAWTYSTWYPLNGA
jgi:hypothetical protein